jgi:hypothetical protein
MSLNKTLDRLFDEIRREAKRNPDFADRLDAVLQRHDSRRDVSDEVMDEVVRDEATSVPPASSRQKKQAAPAPEQTAGKMPAVQAINPAGLYKKDGEDALTAALVALDSAALRALVEENNLDPAGETPAMDEAELVAHIVAQAKRRAERDEKMFDY